MRARFSSPRDVAVDPELGWGDRHAWRILEEFAPGRTEMKLPRRQNPHMHLLEALLALHVATSEKNWLRRAGVLVDLFRRRLVDPATGALIEFFTADWQQAPGTGARCASPDTSSSGSGCCMNIVG